ncbi:predicted protein [Histoplasma capsulatum H143]|uniref:Uncharacterized protein n=1 Tax=Ajellomyces capsulatus (strain H143) TaxID=544712 RepID=C6HFD3_AJECH|nr:predicted protein [Histoplasma capsulatum H143]
MIKALHEPGGLLLKKPAIPPPASPPDTELYLELCPERAASAPVLAPALAAAPLIHTRYTNAPRNTAMAANGIPTPSPIFIPISSSFVFSTGDCGARVNPAAPSPVLVGFINDDGDPELDLDLNVDAGEAVDCVPVFVAAVDLVNLMDAVESVVGGGWIAPDGVNRDVVSTAELRETEEPTREE